jgi:hypothetical protein
MGSSKHLEHGMNAFRTSSLRMASPLGKVDTTLSPRSLMGKSSFVKSMLIISSLAQQMKIITRNLVN